ncbi:NRDE protein-domain-containing protein [Lipomyces japonicus]|uniref:NRDE protein-domain-containing protein n=1 Tax=Lipomyces japonicus TaxID=56871 RepID=UPI0034D00714
MCILLLSTAHPNYPLIVLSNRDEYLNRPTSSVDYWPEPYSDILGPRDLARQEHGTWIGMSKTGRLAVLLNFRETEADDYISPLSRGVLVKHFLSSNQSTSEWMEHAINSVGPAGLLSVGGFNMVCGIIRKSQDDNHERLQPFGVLTNRSKSLSDGTSWLFDATTHHHMRGTTSQQDANYSGLDHTYGISNSLYAHPWPKVHRGRQLLTDVIRNSIAGTESELIENLFDVLSTDELPRHGIETGNPAQVFESLRHSIFIPVFRANEDMLQQTEALSPLLVPSPDDELKPESTDKTEYKFVKGQFYGTRTQTVILVNNDGMVKYVEKTVHEIDKEEHQHEVASHKTFEFKIQDW